MIAEWRVANAGRTPRWPGYGRGPAAIMRLFLADLATAYGPVRDYAVDRLGVDDLTRQSGRVAYGTMPP